MKPNAGIDLHSNSNVVSIIDEQDQVVFEKRLQNDMKHVLLMLALFRDWLVRVAA